MRLRYKPEKKNAHKLVSSYTVSVKENKLVEKLSIFSK